MKPFSPTMFDFYLAASVQAGLQLAIRAELEPSNELPNAADVALFATKIAEQLCENRVAILDGCEVCGRVEGDGGCECPPNDPDKEP